MAYTGQPFDSTVYHAARAKISDGKSVRVKSGSVKVEAGKFYYLEGFLGAAMTSAAVAEVDKEVTLNIEPAEYETDQIKVDEKGSMTVGIDIYWDDTAGAKHFTITATEIYAGKITAAADESNVIWFKLAERPYSLDDVATLAGQVGALASLTTTDKASIVAAINEVDGNVGDLSALTTTEDASVVGAINEVDGKVATKVAAIDDVDNLSVSDATHLKAVATQLNALIAALATAGLMADE